MGCGASTQAPPASPATLPAADKNRDGSNAAAATVAPTAIQPRTVPTPLAVPGEGGEAGDDGMDKVQIGEVFEAAKEAAEGAGVDLSEHLGSASSELARLATDVLCDILPAVADALHTLPFGVGAVFGTMRVFFARAALVRHTPSAKAGPGP